METCRGRIGLLGAILFCGLACARSDPAGRLHVEPASLRLAHGLCAPLRFEWSPARPLDHLRGQPFVFVHLLDRPHSGVRTFDHPLPRAWQPGQSWSYSIDLCDSVLGAAIPPGPYLLTVGLYEPGWGYRWPLDAGGEEVAEREYLVGRIEIATALPVPAFELAGPWAPAERTDDKQIPGRRRLEGPASIRVGASPPGGEIRMALSVAAGVAKVESDCGGSTEQVGAGFHWLGVPRPAAEAPCEIRIDPGTPPAAVSLEVLGWAPQVGAPAPRITSARETP